MDKPKFVTFMQKIKDAYGNRFQELTDSVLMTWYECLGNFEEDKLNKSLTNYVTANEFPPTIADLKKGYDALAAVERQQEVELRRLYDMTVALYPNANREDGLWDVYMDVMAYKDLQSKLVLARKILHESAKYVKGCEESGDEDIIPFSQFLMGGDWHEL